jgi:hypothetical protein
LALINVENLGERGIVKDIPSYQLPQNAWSDGNNVRTLDNAIKKADGYQEIISSCPVTAYFVAPLESGSNYFWIAAGLTKIYAHDGSSWSNITRQSGGSDVDYSATAVKSWTACVVGGVLILDNGVDDPQEWPLTSGSASASTRLQDLSNWPASTECEVMRSFKTFLIALDVTKSSVNYSRLVKWSHEAATQATPTSWDESDGTKSTGEYELASSPGRVIDGIPVGDSFLILKDDSCYLMSYVGTPFIFSFDIISSTIGCLAKNCAAEYEGGAFFMGNSDLYTTDGRQLTPLLPNRLRRYLTDNLSGTNYNRCVVVPDYTRKEMLACFPTTSATYCDKAIIWNWDTNTFTLRDLPDISHATYGVKAIASDYDSNLLNVVFVDPGNAKIFRDNYGNTKDGTNMTSYISREGWTMNGEGINDTHAVKQLRAIYPKMTVSGSNTVNFYVAAVMDADDTISWGSAITFDPNTQGKVPCRVTGRYFGMKVESTTDVDWKLHGLQLDVINKGTRGGQSY